MNPETNEFYEAREPQDPTHINFTIGEEIEIKGHIFKVVHIKMAPHQLVLAPVRKP
jgi:hypothetical protein